MEWFSKSTISNTKPYKANIDKMKLSDMVIDILAPTVNLLTYFALIVRFNDTLIVKFSTLYQNKDVQLIATVYPQSRASSFLFNPNNTWYPLHCFKLACERMYGQLDCYYKRSNKIAWLDSDERNPMVVSEVSTFRCIVSLSYVHIITFYSTVYTNCSQNIDHNDAAKFFLYNGKYHVSITNHP